MEVRDPVHGTISFSNAEAAIIETPEYQRLRSIKQLGFSEVIFPGATHNRYLHSLGVCHLAGSIFDVIFKGFPFSSQRVRQKYRQLTRAAALLHDVGHGPLSHTIEEVMPPLDDLKIAAYALRQKPGVQTNLLAQQRATHEDYTIKYITDSPLTTVLKAHLPEIDPIHIACLIDRSLICPDDFFFEQGIDFRPILSQIVSSEIDADRMDYLERDSYFCGTNYGKIDTPFMIGNLTSYLQDEKLYLALSRRALYTFDDFMISRHHMHLMVYFHHKSIVYEELLNRYLTSPDCDFILPSDINQYSAMVDSTLFQNLVNNQNAWAQRIARRQPYRVLTELHNTEDISRPENIRRVLAEDGIDTIWASSRIRLSKYHSPSAEDRAHPIFVVDQYDRWDKPLQLDQATEIFQRYEGARVIDRIYVAPENYAKADQLLSSRRM